ncbi:helix-turn-helix domain-containing protein [Pseudomonas helleri]|uniref:Helix-turn-helix domain-containing protein n=2 Tax=Pseudomonas helleri TaxID=1608996 RepID=A0A6A7YQG9_9PSED|nr:helix-turn-helix domain-containing protein [Pseudomonas helleri]MQT45561.1 helix-turn-helix domain-containing protein [Pseudomonas helleri]MQT89555.1 helix-turn-helix domain-containing protein [Pseudomonas helleri]
MAGTLFSVIDILRTFNTLWQMRNPDKRGAFFHWRLIDAAGNELPLPDWMTAMQSPAGGRKTLRPSQTALFVPGVQMKSVPDLNHVLDQCSEELDCIARYHSQGRVIAASFNGPVMLARAGVLNGRRATVTWMITNWFASSFPAVQMAMEGPVVVDGPVFTAGAPAAVCDLVVELIRHFAGEEMAQIATNGLLYHPMRFEQSGLNFPGISVKTRDSVVFRAKHWLQQHIQTPYSLERVAQAATASPRTLLRHFKEVEGMTPLDYLHRLRVERAKQLLEVTLIDLTEVMEYCGYQDASAFRRLFRRATGVTPSEYRRRYTMRVSSRWWRADEPGADERADDLIKSLGIEPGDNAGH